ncbi:MAG: hypothetical protein JNM55_13290 [Anaerolineales bacterium]|nr:hypothetical protein [Anaerolineales bacterium]
MEQDLNIQLFQKLELARYHYRGIGYWSGHVLHHILGYVDWRSFITIVEKAKVLCEGAGFPVRDHFSYGSGELTPGKGGTREVDEVGLTRYASYLITQNTISSNKTIAFAQVYFSMQSRKLEAIEQRLLDLERLSLLSKSENELSNIIYERGTDDEYIELIRIMGDEELFGSYSPREMEEILGLPKDVYLADFVSNLPIMVTDLAIEITLHNIRQKELVGEPQISMEYLENSRALHNMLLKRGIQPEALPVAEDIKRIGEDLEHFRRMHMKA